MPPGGLIAAIRNPAQLVVGAFVAFILVGAGLLWLPISADGPGHVGLEDALFTSTSAATVTGLGSTDISRFSLFGELVILALIQIGGFGIMTIGSVLAIIASHRVGLRQRMLAQAEIGAVDIGELRRLILAIGRITLAVEGLLAVVLFLDFWIRGYEDGPIRSAYSGIFHSIAAFNNAGISLYSDNLARFVGDPIVVLGVSISFIIGGLGFPILVELWRRERNRRRAVDGRVQRVPWSLHTKITLLVTAGLLVFGPVVVMTFEWTNPATLGPLDNFDKVLAGWFQGVTPRTAGFNTVDIGGMNEPTLLVISTLMFIGAGPASTSGGIKVTTFAVLGYVLWSEVRGNSDVNVFHRRLPATLIRQALTVALLSIGLVVGASLLLMSTEDLALTPSLFESASAFGTVGLSTGITGSIGPAGHMLLILVMLAGRVGPVTFVTALALRNRTDAYRYPEERPIIGWKILHTMLGGFRPTIEHRGEIIVIGLGRFGSALASTLIDMGHEVLGLDADPERVQQHAGILTHVAEADTTNEQTLRSLGVGDAITAVVAIGADVESSVLTTGALVDLGVPNIWAKALTQPHGRILQRVGAHHVVFPEAEMGSRVARLVTGALIEYFALDDDFVLIETRVPRNLAGKMLGDTDLRATYKVTVVCIKPEGGAFTYAESATILGVHDLIVVAGHRGDIERFARVET